MEAAFGNIPFDPVIYPDDDDALRIFRWQLRRDAEISAKIMLPFAEAVLAPGLIAGAI